LVVYSGQGSQQSVINSEALVIRHEAL
jgi:hypothetical protein